MITQDSKEHRVSAYLEEVIQTIIDEKTGEGASAKYEAYLQNNSLAHYKSRIKYPTYEGLQELLDALELDYREFFQRANIRKDIPVDWATPEQKNMADLLDAMSDQQRATIMEIVKAQLPDQAAEALKENEDNRVFGLRVTNVLEKTSNENNNMFRIYSELGIPAKWRQNKRKSVIYVSAPHEYLPGISKQTGVSLHWLLGWNAPILAKSADTEKVMDYFCFLPADTQRILEQALETQFKSGGIILG